MKMIKTLAAAAALLAIAGAAHAFDYHTSTPPSAVSHCWWDSGVLACESRVETPTATHRSLCAHSSIDGGCVHWTDKKAAPRRSGPREETIKINPGDASPAEQARRAALRAQRGGPQEVPLR